MVGYTDLKSGNSKKIQGDKNLMDIKTCWDRITTDMTSIGKNEALQRQLYREKITEENICVNSATE